MFGSKIGRMNAGTVVGGGFNESNGGIATTSGMKKSTFMDFLNKIRLVPKSTTKNKQTEKKDTEMEIEQLTEREML